MRKIVLSVILLTGFISVYGNPDVQSSDSTSTDSISVIDSAYTVFITHSPQISVTPFIIKLFWIFISVIFIIFAWRYLIHPILLILINKWSNKDKIILTTKSIILVIAIYFILTVILQPPYEVVLIILASTGLTFALASKNLLRDIISGLHIFYSHLIQTGDRIQIGDFTGEVVNLGIKSTQIKKDDETVTIFPNHKITQSKIEKLTSGNSISSVRIFFYFPPDIDIIKTKEIAHRVVSLSRYVYLNKPITSELTNIIQDGQPFVQMCVNAYVLDIEYTGRFKSDVTENVMAELLSKKLVSFS